MLDRLWMCKPVPPISVLRHIAPPTEDLKESKKSSLAGYSCQDKFGMRGGGKSQRFQWKRARAFQKCFAFLHLSRIFLELRPADRSGPEAATHLFRRSTSTWEATAPAACFCGGPGRCGGGGGVCVGGRWWVFLERGDNCSVINTSCGIRAHRPPPENKPKLCRRGQNQNQTDTNAGFSRKQVAVATTLTVSMWKLVQCTRNVYLLVHPLAGAFLR